jgi:dipeptidyl aminopeptidase/acylaminoacyl peptidase
VIRKFACALVALCWAACALAQVDLDRYLKPDTYGAVRISPTGEYYAVVMNLPDRSVLVIQRRADGKVTAKAAGREHSQIADFWWVNDHRVIVAMAEKLGSLDQPISTGELYGLNADGSGAKMLIGAYPGDGRGAETVFIENLNSYQYAELVSTLPKDPQYVLISISGYDKEPRTRVARMEVDTGRLVEVATAPVRRATFAADADGVVRFAEGQDQENYSRLLYRDNDKSDWKLVNDQHASHIREWPLGFSSDGKTAYLQVQQASGPDAIVAYDTTSGARRQVLRDKLVDPDHLLYAAADFSPVGASFVSDRRRAAFLDEQSEEALIQRTLEQAFPGNSVRVTSRTADGQLALLLVSSDTNPGDYYLFNLKDSSADGVFARRTWLDPAKMAPTRSVEFAARDGLVLHGYLTTPRTGGSGLPMVVLPHGGPFGIADSWDFDEESQLLAEAGYAVLRVNYRGSGNYGRAFEEAGAKQWGARMQDDVTDATRWAIAQGVADPKRICIYGASYGAYAAMMGLAREPELYRCGVGYVGVYDLPLKVRTDSRYATWAKNWFADWVGDPATLAAVSPTTLAAKIKQPVFLAAGGKDERAPIEHSKRLEKALKVAGNTPQTLYVETEGHGFYTVEHRQAFYRQLLDFLAANIGGSKAKAN